MLSRISVATAVLAFVVTAVPLNGQEKAAAKYVAPRTADNHPDMQGAWARRGVGLQEANAPSTPLGDFGSTGQPYPTVFNTGVFTTQDRSVLQGRPAGVIDPADRLLPWRPEADAARRAFIPKMIPPASLAYVEKAARCVLLVLWRRTTGILSNHPAPGVFRDDVRIQPCDAGHPNRRPRTWDRTSTLHGRSRRPLGGRDAGGRYHQLQRQDVLGPHRPVPIATLCTPLSALRGSIPTSSTTKSR